MAESAVAASSSLILASASPRRRHLLAALGVAFTVLPVDVDERPRAGEEPAAFARRMADEKARVALRVRAGWVLGADTIVELDGCIFGKPLDSTDASAMLARLSGRAHVVRTAVTFLAPNGDTAERTLVTTEVSFRPLDTAAIAAYVATREPLDKAGAYAIQGEGAHLVDRIVGSYTNVIGLPLPEVATWLRTHRLR
jgi:septum formation protein